MKKYEAQERYRAKNAAAGKCITCGEPAKEGRVRCAKCLGDQAALDWVKRRNLPDQFMPNTEGPLEDTTRP